MSVDTTTRWPANAAKPGEHQHLALARQTITKLGTERITQMDERELFDWCRRLEVTARRLLLLIDTQQAATTRDALIELAELAIDNPELDAEIFESVTKLTPACTAVEGRAFWWGELKACREQYDRGDLTAEGPDHWEARVAEALDKLTGVRR